MNDIYITSEQLAKGGLREKRNEHYHWIKSNVHMLSEEDKHFWDKFLNLRKCEPLNVGAIFLESVRKKYDVFYRVSSKGEALLNRIKQYQADLLLKEAHKSLKRDTQELDRNKYQNSDIWISDRHFR